MAENPEIFNPMPILCLTPLYRFSSDEEELVIGPGVRIARYDTEDLSDPVDEEVGKHLQVFEPDFLLWHDPMCTGDISADEFISLFKEQNWSELTALYFASAQRLFQLFRLFKTRRLRAGETFVISRDAADPSSNWVTLATGRASTMTVDYSWIASQTTQYVLNSIEVPSLKTFRDNLLPILREIGRFPAAGLAMTLYGAENGDERDAIAAITALEALLTKKDETEGLTYRLSMRTANLLGQDASARKQIFQDVKHFYNLRSKLVHGVQPDTKMLNQLNDLNSLRDTVRRVLLSALALFAQEGRVVNLPEILDECAFDDQKRTEVLAKSNLLVDYCGT